MKKKFFISFLILAFIGIIFFCFSKKQIDTRKKFVFWSIQLKPIYEKEMNSIISQFEKKHPDYKVIWVDVPIQEAQKRTLASILSNNPPDLINLNPDFSLILAQKNILEYFDESQMSNFNKNIVNQLRYKGQIYAIPFYATSSITMYNKEIFDSCNNGTIPKTYDELFKIAPKIKSCGYISPFVANLNENDTLLKILNKYGIKYFKNEEEKQKAIQLYSNLNEMYKKEYLPLDVLTINHREVIEKYMSKQVALVVIGTNFIKMVKQNAPNIYSNSQISPQLLGTNGKYDISLMNLIIPKKAQNKDLALEFASTLTNKENQLKLSKLTNVLSVNKYALEDDYFKNCSNDLVDLSRCISAKQLNNLAYKRSDYTNKKELNEILNKTLEEILLDEKSDPENIKVRLNNLFPHLNKISIQD